jgi:hypothetical protein
MATSIPPYQLLMETYENMKNLLDKITTTSTVGMYRGWAK